MLLFILLLVFPPLVCPGVCVFVFAVFVFPVSGVSAFCVFSPRHAEAHDSTFRGSWLAKNATRRRENCASSVAAEHSALSSAQTPESRVQLRRASFAFRAGGCLIAEH